MNNIATLVLVALAQNAAVAPVNEEMLYLSCEGGTTMRVATETSTASAADSRGGSAVASGVTTENKYITGTVLFRLSSGLAEVNVPVQFLSGQKLGDAGWFKVKKLMAADDEITGKLQTNYLATSSFRIDRYSGVMTSDGGFSGSCSPVDVAKKKF